MEKVDLAHYKDLPTIGFIPFGKVIMDISQHPRWEIPPKVAIILAPTGAFLTKEQNPHQPIAVDEIIKTT